MEERLFVWEDHAMTREKWTPFFTKEREEERERETGRETKEGESEETRSRTGALRDDKVSGFRAKNQPVC